MTHNKELVDMVKTVLNYTDEEMDRVASNPKYMDMIEKVPELMNTDFIFEIEEADGCVCQHQQGQKITINGDNSIVFRDSPEKICIYLMNAITPIVYGAQEFIYAGLDPNDLKFTRVGCFDNKATCGGFGHVTVKFRAQSK